MIEISQDAKTSYLTTDDLGSPSVVTDQFGQVVARHDYMPFGEEVLAGVGGRTSAQGYGGDDEVRQKFTGYEHDEETGLDFAEARYYYNNHGRFTAVDPLLASGKSSNPQTFNRYVYVMNSPLRLIDPTGMIAGDYYDLKGNYLAHDGADDGKIHVVYDSKTVESIKDGRDKGKKYTGNVDAKITLPGVNIVTAVNEAVVRSDAATFDKSGFTLEKNQTENGGGFREAGITWDKDGKVTVEPDGPYSDPRKENAGMTITPNTEGSAHVHPSGVITTTTRVIGTDAAGNTGPGTATRRDFIQSGPSVPVDYDHAAKGVNIVVGGSGKDRIVTFYNKNGDLATMTYRNFRKLGGR